MYLHQCRKNAISKVKADISNKVLGSNVKKTLDSKIVIKKVDKGKVFLKNVQTQT